MISCQASMPIWVMGQARYGPLQKLPPIIHGMRAPRHIWSNRVLRIGILTTTSAHCMTKISGKMAEACIGHGMQWLHWAHIIIFRGRTMLVAEGEAYTCVAGAPGGILPSGTDCQSFRSLRPPFSHTLMPSAFKKLRCCLWGTHPGTMYQSGVEPGRPLALQFSIQET